MENRSKAQHADERTMSLVQMALSRPEDEREFCLRDACGTDDKLFERAWDYIKREKEMQGFLLDPVKVLPEEDAFVPGQLLINRFLIVRRVAQGGMGIIWEANDQKLDRRVAIKCAKAGYGKHLPPEVRHAREVSHPSLCKIFEIHTASTPHGEIDFISMEFLQGETLAQRLRAGPLPERKARVIAEQLCAGLAEAHRNGLIHGDLKPSNVILAANREGGTRAVITDFGLARMAESTARTMGGTPAYMAPELWKEKKPSTATDIYALGVMLWELHAGLAVSQLGTASSTLPLGTYIARQPPRGRKPWQRIIARCLDPDPAQRFPDAAAIVQALEPSRKLRMIRIGAVAALLAVASAFATRLWMTASKETVRLALLSTSPSHLLVAATADELARLQGTEHTRFRFISPGTVNRQRVATTEEASSKLAATHALQISEEPRNGSMWVSANLIDLTSGIKVREWKAEYKTAELRFAPVAIAAVVTETLHLLPPHENSAVSEVARRDYDDGLDALRRDQTVGDSLVPLQKAVAADADSALTWAALAEAQRGRGSITGEKEGLRQATVSTYEAQKRNGDLPEVHCVAGLLDFDSGRYEQAIQHFRRAIELAPENDDAYRRLGNAYEASNDLERALNAFFKAIEFGPKHYRNWRQLGDFYFLRANYPKALPFLQRARELAPEEPETLYGLGITHFELGQLASAEQELRSSIALSETATSDVGLGLVLTYEGNDRAAIPYLLRASRLSPQDYLAYLTIGAPYLRLNLKAKSAQAFRQALVLIEAEIARNPRDGTNRAYLAYLCARTADESRSLFELGQALQLAPEDNEVRLTAALTYEVLHRRQDTLTLLSSTARPVLENLGRCPEVADLRRDPRFIELLAK